MPSDRPTVVSVPEDSRFGYDEQSAHLHLSQKATRCSLKPAPPPGAPPAWRGSSPEGGTPGCPQRPFAAHEGIRVASRVLRM